MKYEKLAYSIFFDEVLTQEEKNDEKILFRIMVGKDNLAIVSKVLPDISNRIILKIRANLGRLLTLALIECRKLKVGISDQFKHIKSIDNSNMVNAEANLTARVRKTPDIRITEDNIKEFLGELNGLLTILKSVYAERLNYASEHEGGELDAFKHILETQINKVHDRINNVNVLNSILRNYGDLQDYLNDLQNSYYQESAIEEMFIEIEEQVQKVFLDDKSQDKSKIKIENFKIINALFFKFIALSRLYDSTIMFASILNMKAFLVEKITEKAIIDHRKKLSIENRTYKKTPYLKIKKTLETHLIIQEYLQENGSIDKKLRQFARLLKSYRLKISQIRRIMVEINGTINKYLGYVLSYDAKNLSAEQRENHSNKVLLKLSESSDQITLRYQSPSAEEAPKSVNIKGIFKSMSLLFHAIMQEILAPLPILEQIKNFKYILEDENEDSISNIGIGILPNEYKYLDSNYIKGVIYVNTEIQSLFNEGLLSLIKGENDEKILIRKTLKIYLKNNPEKTDEIVEESLEEKRELVTDLLMRHITLDDINNFVGMILCLVKNQQDLDSSLAKLFFEVFVKFTDRVSYEAGRYFIRGDSIDAKDLQNMQIFGAKLFKLFRAVLEKPVDTHIYKEFSPIDLIKKEFKEAEILAKKIKAQGALDARQRINRLIKEWKDLTSEATESSDLENFYHLKKRAGVYSLESVKTYIEYINENQLKEIETRFKILEEIFSKKYGNQAFPYSAEECLILYVAHKNNLSNDVEKYACLNKRINDIGIKEIIKHLPVEKKKT